MGNAIFAECYILEKNAELAKAVKNAADKDPDIMDPQLIRKANGHYVVMAGFPSDVAKVSAIGRMDKAFPDTLSWR